MSEKWESTRCKSIWKKEIEKKSEERKRNPPSRPTESVLFNSLSKRLRYCSSADDFSVRIAMSWLTVLRPCSKRSRVRLRSSLRSERGGKGRRRKKRVWDSKRLKTRHQASEWGIERYSVNAIWRKRRREEYEKGGGKREKGPANRTSFMGTRSRFYEKGRRRSREIKKESEEGKGINKRQLSQWQSTEPANGSMPLSSQVSHLHWCNTCKDSLQLAWSRYHHMWKITKNPRPSETFSS